MLRFDNATYFSPLRKSTLSATLSNNLCASKDITIF